MHIGCNKGHNMGECTWSIINDKECNTLVVSWIIFTIIKCHEKPFKIKLYLICVLVWCMESITKCLKHGLGFETIFQPMKSSYMFKYVAIRVPYNSQILGNPTFSSCLFIHVSCLNNMLVRKNSYFNYLDLFIEHI